MQERQVRVLGMYDGVDNGCSFYRMISPYYELKSMGYGYEWLPVGEKNSEMVRQAPDAWRQGPVDGWAMPKELDGQDFDIVSLLRPLISITDPTGVQLDPEATIIGILNDLHNHGTIFGGDLDDDLYSVADHNPARALLPLNYEDLLTLVLNKLDFITVTTEYLKKALVKGSGCDPDKIYIVPNLVDLASYDRDDWELETGNPENPIITLSMRAIRRERLAYVGPKPVTIGLQGGASHTEDWKIIANPLKRIIAKFGNYVRIVVAGYHPDYLKESLSEGTEENLIFWSPWTNFEKHAETVMTFDVNLCPLEPTHFNRSKSPIKFLEGSAAGAATIASPTVYGDYITDRVTGLIANTEEEWYQAISNVIENRVVRQTLARNAHAVFRAEYNLQSYAYLWNNIYQDIWRKKSGDITYQKLLFQEKQEASKH